MTAKHPLKGGEITKGWAELKSMSFNKTDKEIE